MKCIAFILLFLAACGLSPVEPDLAVDICVDTFGPHGGRTFTFYAGDSVTIRPWWPEIRVDSLTGGVL